MATAITAQDIDTWLIHYLADLLEVPVDTIDPTANFQELGLDSSLAISLTGDLEEWLGRRINPTLLYNYTTIESLSGGLAEEIASTSLS
ncbi:acyl carrier protein [Cyanobium sp. ATX 6F1]|uniref:acyl carrier protein n=1 Tax=unclassified Cyanobium TaxID=2627006 RepID=UPI0020CD6D7E|nr:acyl carrier protein [Cyanobium sp. ATX 6F1]MCP9916664.1 acyl carrier protein [Cyanobium sp. ATX 6F1]